MPDEPVSPGQLPSDDDFEERFRKVSRELDQTEAADPLSEDYEAKLRLALGHLEEIEFELTDEQLAVRAAQIEAGARVPDLDGTEIPEIERKARELSERARRAQSRYETSIKTVEHQRSLDADAARGAGVGLYVASMMIGFPLVCAAIGLLIDHFAHTHGIAVAFSTLLGAILGVYVGITLLNRHQGGR